MSLWESLRNVLMGHCRHCLQYTCTSQTAFKQCKSLMNQLDSSRILDLLSRHSTNTVCYPTNLSCYSTIRSGAVIRLILCVILLFQNQLDMVGFDRFGLPPSLLGVL